MAATAELLKCTSHGCKETVGVKLCSASGCDKYRCISCVETLILKHGLESVDNPDVTELSQQNWVSPNP